MPFTEAPIVILPVEDELSAKSSIDSGSEIGSDVGSGVGLGFCSARGISSEFTRYFVYLSSSPYESFQISIANCKYLFPY